MKKINTNESTTIASDIFTTIEIFRAITKFIDERHPIDSNRLISIQLCGINYCKEYHWEMLLGPFELYAETQSFGTVKITSELISEIESVFDLSSIERISEIAFMLQYPYYKNIIESKDYKLLTKVMSSKN